MEQIFNEKSMPIVKDRFLSKKNMGSKDSFLNMIKNERGGQHQKQDASIKNQDISSFSGDANNQKHSLYVKQDSDEAHLQKDVILTSRIIGFDQAGQQKKSELHEQKWFSIGKLSYIDSDKKAISYNLQPTNFNSASYSSPGVEKYLDNARSMAEGGRLSSSALINFKKQNDSALQKKSSVEISKLVAQAQTSYDLEKKKISFLKDRDGEMLVIRDYHSNKNHIHGYIKNLLQIAKTVIAKVTFNGKVIK